MNNIDKVQYSINQLSNITIPVAFIEAVGIPVFNVIEMLKSLNRDLIEQEKAKSEGPEELEGPVEPVKGEMLDEGSDFVSEVSESEDPA